MAIKNKEIFCITIFSFEAKVFFRYTSAIWHRNNLQQSCQIFLNFSNLGKMIIILFVTAECNVTV